MLKKQLVILFIVFCSQNSSCFIDDLFKVVKTGWKAMLFANDVSFSKDTVLGVLSIFKDSNEDREVLDKIKAVDSKLNDLKSYVSDKLNNIENLIDRVPDQVAQERTRKELTDFIVITNEKWDFLVSYIKQGSKKQIYVDLAKTIRSSIGEQLPKFRNSLVPRVQIGLKDHGFFMALAQHELGKIDELCNNDETFHNTLTRLFQMVIITEMKAHILLSIAYRLEFSKDNAWRSPCNHLNDAFKEQFTRYIDTYKASLTNTRLPYIRACDRKDSWQRGEDFHELEGLVQIIIYRKHRVCNRAAWNPCSTMKVDTGPEPARCTMNPLNKHATCEGQSYNCIDEAHPWKDTSVCLWNEGPHRIRYITTRDQTMGTDTVNSCPASDLHVDKGIKGFSAPGSFCRCQCVSNKWAFLVHLMFSALSKSVIVGLRISRFMDYFYIRIAEGTLHANGYISDVSWVPITRIYFYNSSLALASMQLDRHAFFFDDLQLPPGYALTGVRFVQTKRSGIEGFGIAIRGAKFIYETGVLASLYEANDVRSTSSKADRELIYKARSSVAMNPYERHHPDSDGYTHISIRESDLDADYGQSTLPFFDGVPIMTNPPSMLGGLGLFHKGYSDHAGFLSLRVYPINYVHLMDTFLQTHNLTLSSVWND